MYYIICNIITPPILTEQLFIPLVSKFISKHPKTHPWKKKEQVHFFVKILQFNISKWGVPSSFKMVNN